VTDDLPRQRLHPLTPLLKGLRLLVLAVAAISWRGFEQLGPKNWLLVVLALTLAVLAFSAVSWRFTGYQVQGRELHIYEGVLARRTRTVPLERLQAIEVRQPIPARFFGLADLRLDVAGAERAEAPLAFLPLAQANALRGRLLTLSHRTVATPAEPAAGAITPGVRQPGDVSPVDPPPAGVLPGGANASVDVARQVADEQLPEVYRVDNREVRLSQFLTPPVMFTPFAVLYIVGQLIFNENHGFFALASMATAILGTIGSPVMRILNFWNFRIAETRDGKLRIQHGLLETRSQTVPTHRIQSLTATWPKLWSRQHWLRVTLAVAGQTSVTEGRAETDRLLPVADFDTARRIVPLALPGVDLADLPLLPVDQRRLRWLAPFRRRILAAGQTQQVFATVDGLLTRQLTLVPYERIQSVRLSQGPLQRRCGVATVHVDVAGTTPATAPHRTLAEAYRWVDELSERARAARATARPEQLG
jgi:putative membrane protein